MNQIYRALHMPPKRLIKKLSGQKEIYTIAVRRAPKGEGCDPLPALGEEPYTPLPYTPGTWYADPLLYEDDNGKRWLFCEAFNMAENRGDIAVAEFDENDHLLPPRVVLKENFHLSFPTVFDWRGEVWMLPETSADHSLTLYRCTQFPDKWEKVQAFSVGRELCDSIIVDKTPEALTVLCSETRPDNQLYTRYRRYTVRENPEAEERDDVDEFILDEDEPFNLQHRNYELGSRNAGPLFTNNDQTVRPAQVSTKVDYGVYLQFWVRRGASEVPLCAAMPQNVAIAGIDPAEVYYHGGDSFNVSALDGEISDYKVASSCGVSLRGMFGGKMGSASTEAFDADAVRQLINGVKESAILLETDEQDEIFAGEECYPTIEKEESDVATTSAEAKIEKCLKLEALAKAADPRIVRVPSAMVASSSSEVILRNSYGLNLQDSGSYFFSYTSLVAKDGTSTAVNGKVAVSSRFDGIDPEKIAADAAKETLSQLNASPVPTGEYRVIFRYDAMQSLLQTFWGVFSAENAQQNLSLFAGKEGENVAADVVTIVDDPLMKGGLATSAFDGEGSASRTKKVVDSGKLTTLLHDRKTARKQGVSSTGNAARVGGRIMVAPTNLYIAAGEKSLDELMADVGNGVVITELAGLHAGANPSSGDFSLLSKGYTIENGKRGRAVEQITVAGNFYQLLKSICAVGSDLTFEGSSIGSPSVDAGMLKISG